MVPSKKYFDPETLASLQTLSLRSAVVLEGLVTGAHRSSLLGHSVEFANHREYTRGDDLRSVDWKVFARRDKYYVKQYEDETNLNCQILLDHSQSMDYQGENSPLSKWEYAQLVCCCIAHMVLAQHDRVGLSIFGDRITDHLPPSGSPAQRDEIIQMLESSPTSDATDLLAIFEQALSQVQSRSLFVLVSDLLSVDLEVERALRLAKAAGNDVLVFRLLDSDEVGFPFDDTSEFIGLESTGSLSADTSLIASAYRRAMQEQNDVLRRLCAGLEFDFHILETSQRLSQVLPPLFESRRWRQK